MISPPAIDPAVVTAPPRLLDVRDAESSAAGHAPGAVRVPSEEWIAAARTPQGAFADTAHRTEAIGALGIGPGAVAGIHDDGRMTEAARVWFILQWFGLPAVILDGGWPAVGAAGLSGPGADPSPPSLTPGSGRVGLVNRARLKADLDVGTILDTRTEAEHLGRDLKPKARGGHLPGAVLLPHTALLDGTRLRATDELRAQFDSAGFTPGRPITTHCDGGGPAALQAGFSPVSFYYLSFSDWPADESCPMVTPGR